MSRLSLSHRNSGHSLAANITLCVLMAALVGLELLRAGLAQV